MNVRVNGCVGCGFWGKKIDYSKKDVSIAIKNLKARTTSSLNEKQIATVCKQPHTQIAATYANNK